MNSISRILLCCLLTTSIAYSQNFQKINISENVEGPNHLETADLDTNGLDDFIVAGTEKLYWFKNVGNSQFTKISLLDSVQGFWHFSLFDWEGDGDMDIFFTTYYIDQRVAWLENDGLGNFTYHLISKTVNNPLYVQAWDLDQDNDVDILVSSSSTDQLYWLKNDGFNNYTPDTIGNYVNHFSIADLDGDNDWDIIFGRAYTGITYSSVRALQNDGNNNFGTVTLKSGFNIIHEVIVEDVNGDSFFDIVVPDYYGDKIVWLKNDGTYGFSTQNTIKSNFDGPESIALLDVNEDGKKDLISGSYNDDEIYYFQGQGSTSSFAFSSGSLIYSGLNQITDLAIGNFDNQNKKDFVHADRGNDEISVWTNNGSQQFTQDQLSSSFDSPRAFDMADLDGDGDQDFAAVSNDGDKVAWMENLSNDEFETHTLLTNYEEPYTIKINDLDDDGDYDIIAASDFDDRMTWWKNDGTGIFTMIHITTSLNGPRDLWIEDFDNDGDKDIAVICFWLYTKSGNTGAQLFQNDGSENFTRVEIDDDIRAGYGIRGANMNNDTLVDLVISSYLYTQSRLRIATNNGNGFTVSNIDDLLCIDFEICDFDGDNDNDILAIDYQLDSLYLYENTGNLNFSKSTIAYYHDLYSIEPCDFDGDGDMDVLFSTGYNGFTNGGGYEWGIFRNDGLGNLTSEIWYQNLSNIKPLEVFDYENDGDFDVVLGFDYLDKITLYKNFDANCHINASVTVSGNSTFCANDSVFLQATSSHADVSFQWYRNNQVLTNDTASTLWTSTAGTYYVAVSDTGCTKSSNQVQLLQTADYLDTAYSAICQNDSLIIDGQTIKTSGTYNFNYSSYFGCDSSITLVVTEDNIDQVQISHEMCSGSVYDFNGTLLTATGNYSDTLQNQQNCDSVVSLQLDVFPVYQQSQTLETCSGDSVLMPNNTWQNQGGTYMDTLTAQTTCDSIWTTQVIVHPTFQTAHSESICSGDSALIYGQYQMQAGVYVDTLSTLNYCDSIHTVTLTVIPVKSGTSSLSICQGDSVLLGGSYQTSAGIYIDSLTAQNTCDSILSTTLIVNPIKTASQQLSICQGDSVFIANQWRTQAGNYVDTLNSALLCDSILISTLVVNPTYSTNLNLDICQGDSVFIGGNWQSSSGTYVDSWPTLQACDSVVSTNLTVTSVNTTVTRTGNTLQANSSPANYQWLDCDAGYSIISGATNAIFIPTVNGSYAVEITENGCIDTSNCYFVADIGFSESTANQHLKIYPNPTSDILHVEADFGKNHTKTNITIISSAGSVLLKKRVTLDQGKLVTQLQLDQFASGSYLIKLESTGMIITRSFVLRK